MHVLYLTYDGLCDPLGQSQVLPYIKALSEYGIHFTVISLEKTSADQTCFNETREICNTLNINWIPLKYINSDSGWKALLNIRKLYSRTKKVIQNPEIDFIHCRSYIPAYIAYRLCKPYLFDMRGFWIDERVEGKIWSLESRPHRLAFRYLKKLEPLVFQNANHIISLTRNAVPRIKSMAPDNEISVIPCVADHEHFVFKPENRSLSRNDLEIRNSSEVMVYLGSLGSWYMPEEMMDFFKVYLAGHPDAIFLLITPDTADSIYALTLKKEIPQASVRFIKSGRSKVPYYLSAANFAISFIRDLPSKSASSPTKIAEYAYMGLPVIYNPVGDLSERPVEGCLVKNFSSEDYLETITKLEDLDLSTGQIRAKALQNYNIKDAVEKYLKTYNSVLSSTKV